MKLLNIISAILFCIIMGAPTQRSIAQSKTTNIESVNLCDLIKNPTIYSDKTIRIKATYRYGAEWSELYCSNCWNGRNGRIWVDFDKSFEENTNSKVAKNLEDAGEIGRTVNVDFIGRLVSSDKKNGHMSAYQFKFIAFKAVKARIIANESPIPTELETQIKKQTFCNNM